MLRNGSRRLKIISVCFSLPLLVSIAASLSQPDAALAGRFSKTCLNERIEFDESGRVVLVASCKDNKDGSYLWNDNGHPRGNRRLLISDSIANYEGNLAWAHNGSFQASCTDIRLETSTLWAKCGDGKGGHNVTSLNLDEKISNQAGVLDVDDF